MNQNDFTLMVVEDEPLLRKVICKKLELVGIKVVPCENGRSALDYLQKETMLPHAIWLDYTLGDMTGLDIVSFLKSDTRLSSIPVIVVSNSASDDKVQHMLALGVKRYIVKAEFRLEEIIDIIKELTVTPQ